MKITKSNSMVMRGINFLRAIKQVYSFEIRMFFNSVYHPNMRFYMIEDTTRNERVRMYKESWSTIGYIRGRKLLDHLKNTYKVRINIYGFEDAERVFIHEYEVTKEE